MEVGITYLHPIHEKIPYGGKVEEFQKKNQGSLGNVLRNIHLQTTTQHAH